MSRKKFFGALSPKIINSGRTNTATKGATLIGVNVTQSLKINQLDVGI